MSDENKPTIIKGFPGQKVEQHLREHGCLPGEVCYTAMRDGDLLDALGVDAQKWAAAFCQHARKLNGLSIDPEWATTWFANAMMAMHDHGRGPINGDHAQHLLDKAVRTEN